jgi:hypothetical protein
MKEHSIVSPLQAKRERENEHLVNIPQNAGPNEKLYSLPYKQEREAKMNISSKYGTK